MCMLMYYIFKSTLLPLLERSEMFSKIDNSLIVSAQWIVRQFELYSSATRKSVGDKLIKTLTTLTLLGLATGATFAFIGFTKNHDPLEYLYYFGISFAFFIGFFAQVILLRDGKRILNKEQKDSLLPEEIVTREYKRKMSLYENLFLFPLFLITLFIQIIYSNDTLEIIKNSSVSGLFFATVFNELALEYLFCTTSLPPGEKKRREQEKETRHMNPQKISW